VINNKTIGGYFGLEQVKRGEYWNNAIKLNTARNCLRYIIRAYNIKKLYVPQYTCPVVWEAIHAENCEIVYYPIDFNFMPAVEMPTNEYILYTNYFGVCSNNIKKLFQKYPLLIVDCAQSFYSNKMGLASFNSARKFFGVPDGAYLFTDKIVDYKFEQDISSDRASHLLMYHDFGSQAGYATFKYNEEQLCNKEIKLMSKLTESIMSGIDYINVAKTRRSNFFILHKLLCEINEWHGEVLEADVPMVYPLIYRIDKLKEKLIEKNIFIATYWKGQLDLEIGKYFEHNLLPIPIDQRYNSSDMKYIADCIFEIIKEGN
jgi:hypothetical protein